MKNNFTFCASIKVKELEKMTKTIEVLNKENISNNDLDILLGFKNLLDKFDDFSPKMYELIDSFASFYEAFLVPYCKEKLIMCERFEEFDFEQIQYVMEKMKEIINIIYGEYGL